MDHELEAWLAAYLLNAVWQVSLVWLVARTVAGLLRRKDAAIEHGLWVGALLLEVGVPLSAMGHMDARMRWWLDRVGSRNGSPAEVRVEVLLGHGPGAAPAHATLVGAVLLVFGAMVVRASVRLCWRYWQTLRMVRAAEPVPLAGVKLRLWEDVCSAFGLQGVAVLQSADVSGPMTCGVWRRSLILPPGLADGVSDAEWRALVAHECAHMRRRDFAKNLLFEAVRLPLAWHPAAWATRAWLEESREWVCDAMAAEECPAAEGYARSLLRLASRRVAGPARQFHAIGIFDANTLEERVMRLTGNGSAMGRAQRGLTVVAGGLLAMGVCAPAWAWGVHAGAATATVAQEEPAAAPVRVASGVMAGEVVSQTPPMYPPEAKAAGIEGKVVLHAVIGTDGNLSALRLVSGPPELKKAAFAAVSQWVWKPYLLNGEPTPVETEINVNFKLNP